MITSPWTSRRLLIPRWRSLIITIGANELAAPYPTIVLSETPVVSFDLLEKLDSWRDSPNVMTAGELVGSSLVVAQENKAVEAAQFLLSTESSATVPLRRLAALALLRAGLEEHVPVGLELNPQVTKRGWRKRTRMYSTNALAWVELSLHDLVIGKKESAKRSMLVALQLAPTNRHVLRSASRLFLHLGDAERAYDTIADCESISSDPWLIAAELSIANLAERKPQNFARGRSIVVKGGLAPRQITELAGAIGTLELVAGHRRKARKYFRQSLIDPTGNALAQAEWASPLFGFELVTAQHLNSTTEVDEAKVLHLLHKEKFSEVPDMCRQWSNAEGYAIRPYEIASSATALVGNHSRTIEIVRKGLTIKPNSAALLNNYAFALSHTGKLNEAEHALRGIQRENELNWLVSEANRGLLAMRQKNHVLGLTHYKRAINGFSKKKDERSANIARIYLAREAALANIPEAEALIKNARAAISRLNTSTHNHVIQEAEQALISPLVL
ncbi:MAG: hypothetical protein OXL36_01685 [Bryobacterales bacterium]|nr:hypothetical protein [Bryobacterales bacterium]MDE0296069.1 hypothetical protein [Bryobacterales bacterium]